MRIRFELSEDGFTVSTGGSEYQVGWPEEVWKGYGPKSELARELAFLHTLGAPFASGEQEVVYDHPPPRFLDRYHEWFRLTLPYLRDRNPTSSEKLTLEAVARVRRTFRGEPRLDGPVHWPETSDRRAVVALTMGKDSLASLLIGKEMGLELAAVHCGPSADAGDLQGRISRMTELGAHLSIPVHTVCQRERELRRSPFGEVHPTGMIWPLSVAICCLMLLPFAHHYGARLVVLGNEFGFNYPIRPTAGGEPVELSPLQTTAGTSWLDTWIRELTGGAVGVTSLIHSLHTIACHKLVHSIRPDVGLHQVSCRRPPAGDNPRWCQQCPSCAENYLFITAMGQDPAAVGFTRSMFDEKSAAGFHVVANGLDEHDPYRFHAARQELLAFHLARRRAGDSWAQQYVLQKYGELSEREREALERAYLEPVGRETPLPMSARSTAAARRLLSYREPNLG
jgi:hypothetical protein